MKIQTAPTQSFSEHAPSFSYRLSMDTRGPLNPPSQLESYFHVIIYAFSHFVVRVPIKSNNAKTAIKLVFISFVQNGNKIETLVLISVCSFKTLLRIDHFKYTCTLTHTIRNLFQNSTFSLMKLFSTHNPEYHLPLIRTLIVIPQKSVFLNTALNFQNTLTMTKRI